LDAGFVIELALSGATINRMISRGFFSAEADREDAAAVGAAALAMLGLSPSLLRPSRALAAEAKPDKPDPRRGEAAALFCAAIGMADLPSGCDVATAEDFDCTRARVVAAASATDLRAALAIRCCKSSFASGNKWRRQSVWHAASRSRCTLPARPFGAFGRRSIPCPTASPRGR
jgi:hypothetical protein